MNERVSIGGQVAPAAAASSRSRLQHVDEQQRPPRRRGRARPTRAVLDRGRGQPAHEHARVAVAREGHARARGLGRQDGDGRPQPAADGVRHGAARSGRDALSGRLPDGPADDGDGPVEPAEGVPPRAGQLDRGRHDQHHEEHPRRAGARACPASPGPTRTSRGARYPAASGLPPGILVRRGPRLAVAVLFMWLLRLVWPV